MTEKLDMPERRDVDGQVGVDTTGEHTLTITVTHGGHEQHIVMSRHNAWRVFGMLALILGIPLPPKVGKAIKL